MRIRAAFGILGASITLGGMVGACGASGSGPGEGAGASSGTSSASSSSGKSSSSSGAGGSGGGGGVANAVECPAAPFTPPADGSTCEVTTAKTAGLLLRGTVLAPDKVYHRGEVLLDDKGIIACVGCDCSKDPAAANASVVTCADGVISPGLIDPHDHITYANNKPGGTNPPPATERWEHRHDWRKGLNGHTKISTNGGASVQVVEFAELRHVMGGATSGATSGGEKGLLRNVDKAPLLEGLPIGAADFDTFPLGDSSGVELAMGCAYPAPRTTSQIAGEKSYLPHVAEGIGAAAENEFACEDAAGPNDIIQPQTAMIHGVGLDAKDLGEAKKVGAKVIWSPRSNISLYGNTAPVTAIDAMGIPIALGTDWVPSGSITLLRELACADSLNTTYFGRYFSDAELWKMVTSNAALTVGAEAVVGSLAAGLVGDVAVFDGSKNADYRAIIAADAPDVVLVLRGGKVLYGDDALVASAPLGGAACEALDVCSRKKRACVAQDLGNGDTLASVRAAGEVYYPLFACGAPMNEPSCVPFRGDPAHGATYTGVVSPADGDGDGIADAKDDCPKVFNPVRPMDGAAQADGDGDGKGDACDPCPLDAKDTCPPKG
jgi:cytosine/adenosine deaminase-related metal-dependent hydrolase